MEEGRIHYCLEVRHRRLGEVLVGTLEVERIVQQNNQPLRERSVEQGTMDSHHSTLEVR